MADDTEEELLFCDTFSHENKEELNLDLVQFPWPVCIQEVRVIPHGSRAHPEFREEARLGQTTPGNFKLELFINNLSKPGSAIFEQLGTLEYNDSGDIQFLAKSKVPTDGVVLRGWYHKLTIAIYGMLTVVSKPRDERKSQSPPPPPPPPPKHGVKRPVEEPHPVPAEPAQPRDWDWEKREKEQEAKRPRYSEHAERHPERHTERHAERHPDRHPERPPDRHVDRHPERSHTERPPDKVVERPRSPEQHAIPVTTSQPTRRGPRTPSPPPPTDTWEPQRPPEGWPNPAESGPEWKTQDTWEAPEPEEPPPPARTWEQPEANLAPNWEASEVPPQGDWGQGEQAPPRDWEASDPAATREWESNEPAPPRDWEQGDTWETTDSWEMPDEEADWEGNDQREPEQDYNRWQDDRRSHRERSRERTRERDRGSSRKQRGPRTPPGEPKGPATPEYDSRSSRRSRERSREKSKETDLRKEPREPREPPPEKMPEEEGNDEELFEAITPDRSSSEQQYSDIEANEEDRLVRDSRDDAASEDMTQAYEEILSDEEDMGDIGSLDSLLEEGFSQDALELEGLDEPWPDLVPFNPYQMELMPLTTFVAPDQTLYETEKAKIDPRILPVLSEDAKKIVALLNTHRDDEHGPKWVGALEDLPSILNPGLAYLDPEMIHILIEWTLEALNLEKAMTQPIAVNMRQIKAGMRIVSAMCDCGPEIADQLVLAGVQDTLFELLFAPHMASSMKVLAIKALDSTTNFKRGILRFLGFKKIGSVLKSPTNIQEAEENPTSGYQKILKLLLSNQAVRVVTAATALLKKIHVYEVLERLQETVDGVVEKTSFQEGLPEDSPIDKESQPLPTVKPTQSIDDNPSGDPPSADPLAKSGDDPVVAERVHKRSLASTPEPMEHSQGESMEGDVGLLASSASSAEIDAITECLEELTEVLHTASFTIVQQPLKAFPTTCKVTGPPNTADPYPMLFGMFKSRKLLESILVIVSCPATSGHEGVCNAVRELLLAVMNSLNGLLFLTFNPDTTKALFQALTPNYDEDSPEEGALQQVGLQMIHSLATLQLIDQLKQITDKDSIEADRDRDEIIDTLISLYILCFTPTGRTSLANVFALGDNLECLLHYAELKGDEETIPKIKKSTSYGYASQLLLYVVQYSDSVPMLKKYLPNIICSCKEDSVLSKWVAPVKSAKLEMSSIGKLVDYMEAKNADLLNHFTGLGPGMVTCLRVLRHLVCAPKYMQSGLQQKELHYNLAIVQLFSSAAMNTFITTLKKLNDFLLRPWQMGHALSGTQEHLIEAMVVPLLKLTKTMLSELLESGSSEFRDERLVTQLLPLHTYLCSVPTGGLVPPESIKIQSDIVDILLTYTKPLVQQPDSEEAITNSTWTLMIKEVLQYIPSSPYAYIGGLTLLSELLPLPLPMTSSEPLDNDEVQKALNLRRLWSLHLHSENAQIQTIIKDLAGSSCLPLQHLLRRVCWQLADLAAPTALSIVRTLLEMLVDNLGERDKETKQEQPCSPDAARLLTLLVYLVSQPVIKASILHILKTSPKTDEKVTEVLPRLLSLLNLCHTSPSHQQSQECIVALLQSLCGPDITLLSSDNLSISEQLTNSMPGKDHMEAICTALFDHVTSPDQSYASILLSLRTLAMLLDHDYGFYHLKCTLTRSPGAFYNLFKRLSRTFSKSSSDYLSTLSTSLDLLQMLLTTESPSDMDQEAQDELSTYRTYSLRVAELCGLLKWNNFDHPIKRLEKMLADCCKKEESLEGLLENINSLVHTLDAKEDPQLAASKADVVEVMLPPSSTLSEQFNTRMVYYLGDAEEERVSASYWLGPPPTDEADPEQEMVKFDLDDLCSTYLKDLDLKAELEKTAGTEEAQNKIKKKTRKNFQTFRLAAVNRTPTGIRRSHHGMRGRGGRGRGGMRGGRYYNDPFRQRPQNTSRPPSMHVDDFVLVEEADVGQAKKSQRGPSQSRNSSSRGNYSGGTGNQRGGGGGGGGGGGFQNRGPWNGPNNYRRDDGIRGRGGRGRDGIRGRGGRGRDGFWGRGGRGHDQGSNTRGRGTRGRGQWGNRMTQQRTGYGGGGGGGQQQRQFTPRRFSSQRQDNRMENRQDNRSQPGQQSYGNRGRGGRPGGDDRGPRNTSRDGSYGSRGGSRGGQRGGPRGGGMRGSRGGPSGRRGGRGFRSGGRGGRGSWGGQGGKDRFQSPMKPGRGGRTGGRDNPRHSRSFTR